MEPRVGFDRTFKMFLHLIGYLIAFNYISFYQQIAFYETTELATKPEEPIKVGTLVVALTSDRGLCGAVHSSVAKRVRGILNTDANSNDIRIITIGDKAKLMLAKQYPQNILMMFNDFGKRPPSFGDATTVANAILNCGYEFDQGIILYNRFKSVSD